MRSVDIDNDDISRRDTKRSKNRKFGSGRVHDAQILDGRSSATEKGEHKRVSNTFWVIVNVLCGYASYFYIRNAYDAWQNSPVVQALSNSQIHVDNITFPAVTICWPDSFKEGYNYTNHIKKCLKCHDQDCTDINMTHCDRKEMIMLALARQMCPQHVLDSSAEAKLLNNVPQAIDGTEFDEYMEQLLPSCESEKLTIQKYAPIGSSGTYSRCSSEVVREFYSGNWNKLCVTYNSLKHEDILNENVVTTLRLKRQLNSTFSSNITWSFDNMMTFNGNMESVPIYGLKVFFIKIHGQQRNYESICKHYQTELASLIIHSPNEIPLTYSVDLERTLRGDRVYDIIVDPKITVARQDLAQYAPEQRGCFFAHEKELALFKYYTKKNCEFECLANAYLNVYGCVPFYFPRHNASVKVCLRESPEPAYHCDCVPDCNYVTYPTLSLQETAVEDQITTRTDHNPPDGRNTTIFIAVSGVTFQTTIRYSITTQAEFLAYSLGILGAFLGLSITCLWQIFFEFSVKMWHVSHKRILP